jgi:hypothetical protein
MARHEALERLQAIAAARGAAVTNLVHGWRGALLPAPSEAR